MTTPKEEAIIEADLIDFLRGGSIIIIVLGVEEREAAYRLANRGVVQFTYPTAGHILANTPHVGLVP